MHIEYSESYEVTICCESEEDMKRTMATLQCISSWVPVSIQLPAENAVTEKIGRAHV